MKKPTKRGASVAEPSITQRAEAFTRRATALKGKLDRNEIDLNAYAKGMTDLGLEAIAETEPAAAAPRFSRVRVVLSGSWKVAAVLGGGLAVVAAGVAAFALHTNTDATPAGDAQ